MVGPWSRIPLSVVLARLGADITAGFVGFEYGDSYNDGINMPTAPLRQALMGFRLAADLVPTRYGSPFKIRIPTKLGFKSPEFVTTLCITNQRLRGFWTDRVYDWFSGI